ncbi:Deoxyribonucleoside regulator [Actinomyces bovis]|uniref:Deoxyribonucleoside regulator n=1 Tax=Actinomyces bovis TaxID=1658 RepID=A0ABY1VLM0_9ACTO|nr:sugar-binding domain-containing protein [Actinomyces bovis]SPT52991.1 Deoxyribonucleoside regulator [Actinomyces bovis]VEG55222.1 Deoxyribonucleoside regulator [Actinomyces israelii]
MPVEPPRNRAQCYEAASMYYVQGETMEVIARHLGTSRSTVSRLLARAREEGIVRITLAEPGGRGSLESELREAFGVDVRIVPVREGTTEIHRLEQVAAVAARRLIELAPTDGVIGTAWGTTMSEVCAALPANAVPGLTVVQLNGASDPDGVGPSAGEVLAAFHERLGARTVAFPVPAFFDHASTREAMWSERSVRRVLMLAQKADLAVFGVGTAPVPGRVHGATLPSQVYAGGHLTDADRLLLQHEDVVGDVCTVMLRADGSWRDIPLNRRATGPTPEQLAKVPRRLCVVAGTGKARALLAALRARVATDLVVDEATARAIIALPDYRQGRTRRSR